MGMLAIASSTSVIAFFIWVGTLPLVIQRVLLTIPLPLIGSVFLYLSAFVFLIPDYVFYTLMVLLSICPIYLIWIFGDSGKKGLEKLEELEKSYSEYQQQFEKKVEKLSAKNFKIYEINALSKNNAPDIVSNFTSTGMNNTLKKFNEIGRVIQKILLENAYNKNLKVLVQKRIAQRKEIVKNLVEIGSSQLVLSVGTKLKQLAVQQRISAVTNKYTKKYSRIVAQNLYQAAKSRAIIAATKAHKEKSSDFQNHHYDVNDLYHNAFNEIIYNGGGNDNHINTTNNYGNQFHHTLEEGVTGLTTNFNPSLIQKRDYNNNINNNVSKRKVKEEKKKVKKEMKEKKKLLELLKRDSKSFSSSNYVHSPTNSDTDSDSDSDNGEEEEIQFFESDNESDSDSLSGEEEEEEEEEKDIDLNDESASEVDDDDIVCSNSKFKRIHSRAIEDSKSNDNNHDIEDDDIEDNEVFDIDDDSYIKEEASLTRRVTFGEDTMRYFNRMHSTSKQNKYNEINKDKDDSSKILPKKSKKKKYTKKLKKSPTKSNSK